MAGDDEVLIERVGPMLCVVLNRPHKRNPLSRAVLARLREIFLDAAGDAELACAVLTGAGDQHFAAGGDLRDLAQVRDEEDVRNMATQARAALDAIRTFPLPVVALLNGDAIGGGAELALACDLRVMREGTRIGYIHGRLAITSAWGGGPDLVSLVGSARALRMTTRCEMIDAATALAWGLADAIAPRDDLEGALQAFVAPLLAQSPTALRGCKAQALAGRRGLAYDERRAIEQDYFVSTWTHADHWAAVDRVFGSQR